jgi:hypothetical protein
VTFAGVSFWTGLDRLEANSGQSTSNSRSSTRKGRTMKSKSVLWTLLATLTVGMALAALIAVPGSPAQAAGTPRLSDQLFARQIAGSYLADLPALEIQVLLKPSADGGTLRVSNADAGYGGTAPFASRTPALGNWKRTGDRTIQVVEVEFDFDAGGLPMPITEKILVELSFAKDWLSFSGSLKVLVYAPGSDVIEDEPVLVLDLGTVEGRRVR